MSKPGPSDSTALEAEKRRLLGMLDGIDTQIGQIHRSIEEKIYPRPKMPTSEKAISAPTLHAAQSHSPRKPSSPLVEFITLHSLFKLFNIDIFNDISYQRE